MSEVHRFTRSVYRLRGVFDNKGEALQNAVNVHYVYVDLAAVPYRWIRSSYLPVQYPALVTLCIKASHPWTPIIMILAVAH